METVEALALVRGRVDEELLLRNEYLAAENEILKSKLDKPLKLNNYERIRLAKELLKNNLTLYWRYSVIPFGELVVIDNW